MSKNNVVELSGRDEIIDPLTELLKTGAQRLICQAVEAELQELLAEDGVRESTQSWREVLLKLKSRGMNVPELAVGDGAMGFWAALEEVYPETRHQLQCFSLL